MNEAKVETRLRRAVDAVGWICFVGLIPLAVMALARITHVDDSIRLVVLLESFTVYLYLPAYLTLVFATAARLRWLGLLSAALIICHVTWVAPELESAQSLRQSLKNAPTFTLYSHNVRFDNDFPQLLGPAISAKSPDVVMLQELSYPDLDAINESHALDGYEYHYTYMADDFATKNLGIWAKFPVSDFQLQDSPGFPSLRARAEFHGTKFTLWNVHAFSPIGDKTGDSWRQDLGLLHQRLSAEHGPVVVGGDFNSTYGHRRFRSILDDGYTDAAISVGRGFSRTWPAVDGPGSSIGGLICIDHVLTRGGEVQPTHLQEDQNAGSDHRALVATIAVKASD